MSRFFAASDSDSESSSDEEINLTSRPVAPVSRQFVPSDDEEETKRVVRSAKDKRFDELRNIIKTMKNHKKIKDMANILSAFESLQKAHEKARKVVAEEGNPRFFIRSLAELEDFITECWENREGRKAMSKNNAKSLTTIRQKLKKYNKEFENDLAKYRENPDEGDEVEVSEEEKDSGDEDLDIGIPSSETFKKTPTQASKAIKDEGDSDDSIDWDMSSSSDSDSDMDESKYEGNLAAMFLKKTTDKDSERKKEKEKKRTDKERRREADKDDEDEWQEVKGGAPVTQEKPKMFSKDAEINHENVLKKLVEIVGARGKKGTDRTEQVELLKELRHIAQENKLGEAMDVKILFAICGAMYDYNPNIAASMKPEMWEKCITVIKELQEKVIGNKDIQIGEHISDDSEHFDGEPPFRVRGCLLTVVERLDEEYIKMLQACDAHSTEYVLRLADEQMMCQIIEDLQHYLESYATTDEICRAYIKRIEHLYYKFEPRQKQTESQLEESRQIMEKLCKYIYAKDNTDRIRTRAILYHIYHHSLHDRWYEARDLMLMSHLQDTIEHADIPTQIIYNRSMVQLGLCAFRAGMIRDAHNNLVDIQSGGRAKEMLAQGLLLQRQHERTPEQEKIEKRRQMPYHMHINLELLECVYLVSAMLLEIPYMAAHELDARRRMISKNFHHVLRMSERQPLVGPPESMREHVVAASKAMKRGDWKACKNFIINEKMNAKVWALFHNADHVRDMIARKIQEESLRTYLFTFSSIYDSLSLETLSKMFELEKSVAHSIISKMILNEELMASLDEPTQTVIMHRTEPTRLQALALQLSEKVSSLLDNNERLYEAKHGNFSFIKQGQQQFRGGEGGNRFQGGYQRQQQGNYRQQSGGRGFQGNRYANQESGGGYNRGAYARNYNRQDSDSNYRARQKGGQY